MAIKQGTGVELELEGNKAKVNIQEIIDQLTLLEKKVAEINRKEITLKSKLDDTAYRSAAAESANYSAKAQSNLEKIAKKSSQTNATILKSDEETAAARRRVIERLEQDVEAAEDRMARNAEKAAREIANIPSGIGKTINSIGGLGGKLNRSITDLSNSLISPIRGVFSSAKNFVTSTVNDSISQIEKLELAEVGLQNHFKNDKNFNKDEYIQRIRRTAETTQGLSAGDLADYISQLAPLTQGNSEEAFAAAMGALKIIRYGGGDTTVDMMSVIKNIRDVQAKGKAYQMDLNQFNRAAPLLATMLEQQGMGEYVKRTDSGALTLNITKENADSLVTAFAKLNDNKELNDVFNAMTGTLSGLIEQTRQSISNDVMDLIKYDNDGKQKSLLDLWKGFLQGNGLSSLRGMIQKRLQKAVSKLVSFLDSLNGKEIITTVFGALEEFGEYVQQELLPILKQLLGIDEGANATETIKGIIRLILKYGKGLVDGIKGFLTILEKGKSLAEKLIGNDGIMAAFGWVKGFGKVGWDLVAGAGNIVTGFGRLTSKIASFGSFLGKWTNKYGKASGILGGAGSLLTVAGLGTTVVDAFVDDRPAEDKMLLNDISAGISGLGVALQTGSPLLGAIAGVAQLTLKSLTDKWQDVKKIREIVAQEQEASKTDLQGRMVTEVIKQMANKKNPIFFANDPISQGAEQDVRKWAVDNITPDMTPLEMQQKIRDKLQERIAYRTGHAKVAELSNEYLNNPKYNGPTQITAENANQYTAQIRKLWDYYDKYGFLQKMEGYENLPDELTGQVMWKFLYGDGSSNMIANIGSKEALDLLVSNLGQVDAAVKKIEDSDTELEWEVKLNTTSVDEMKAEMTRAMRAMGFDWVNGRGWVTTLHYRTEMETTGDLSPFEDNPKQYSKGYLSSTDIPRPAKFGNGTYAAPVFKSFDKEPSEEDKQRARVAYGFANDKSAYLDKMAQWNGASSRLDTISAEDRENYDNDLDSVIQNSLNMYNNGEAPNEYEQALLVEALIRRYGTWGEVIKNRGQLASSYLFQMVAPFIQKAKKANDMDMAYKAIFTMLTQPRDVWEKDGRGDLGIYLDGVNDEWKKWLQKLYGDLGTVQGDDYIVHRAGGGPIPRPPKPIFFDWGGSARGVDTVPAMLRPGEFVEKTTAVNKAGLGVMNALNEGDLGRAYRLLGAKLNTVNTNSYDSRRYNTTDSHNVTTNNFRFFNNSQSAVKTSYRGLRNIMALH